MSRRPLWPAWPPPLLELELARLQVQLVVRDQDLLGRDLEKRASTATDWPGAVHGSWARAARPAVPRSCRARRRRKVAALRVQVDLPARAFRLQPPETGVVASILVFRAWVAQADQQFEHGTAAPLRRPNHGCEKPAEASLLPENQGLRRITLPFLPSCRQQQQRPGNDDLFLRLDHGGDAGVRLAVDDQLAPAGRTRSSVWMDWPLTALPRSTVMNSGICIARRVDRDLGQRVVDQALCPA